MTRKQQPLPGHRRRKTIAITVGIASGVVAFLVGYFAVVADLHRALAEAGDSRRLWWQLVVVVLLVGSSADAITFWLLERGARRAHDARIPRAQAR